MDPKWVRTGICQYVAQWLVFICVLWWNSSDLRSIGGTKHKNFTWNIQTDYFAKQIPSWFFKKHFQSLQENHDGLCEDSISFSSSRPSSDSRWHLITSASHWLLRFDSMKYEITTTVLTVYEMMIKLKKTNDKNINCQICHGYIYISIHRYIKLRTINQDIGRNTYTHASIQRACKSFVSLNHQ